MKKLISVTTVCTLITCMAALGFAGAASAEDSGTAGKENNKTSLVVYFDWEQDETGEQTASGPSEPDELSGASSVNREAFVTPEERMARMLAENTDSDLFEIIPENPYPQNEAELAAAAAEERSAYARPAYQGEPADWASYDRIYIGYPVRDEEMPMIVLSFLENHDFTGKTVLPFDCYYGRTMEGAEVTIATVTEVTTMEAFNLDAAVMESDPGKADAGMREWMNKIGIAE